MAGIHGVAMTIFAIQVIAVEIFFVIGYWHQHKLNLPRLSDL